VNWRRPGTGSRPRGSHPIKEKLIKKPGADILTPDDKGRFAVTKTVSDQYVFRAAPLRNIALTAPYFHSGQVWDLEQAVGIMSTAQLGSEMTAHDTQLIAAFLTSLTGQQSGLSDPPGGD
jgi:cytochrome c peroxidase